MDSEARIIQLPKITDPRGNLSIIEQIKQIPFEIKRVHWVYDVPGGYERGGHAYKETEEFIVALSGSFDVVVDDGVVKMTYQLNRSYFGLLVPKGMWRTMTNFSTNSLALVLSSTEYDENDYIEPIQDYEGEEYVPQDEGLTFAEKEELRYERELQMEKLKKELSSDDNAIVTIHEEERREDIKDQALEDIIQIADEDYKEIEKERFKNNNTLKSFDDNKLPKRGNIEDEIVDYKFASDFGLNSQEDLFNQPINNVSNSINEIVNVEGPIHVNDVVKRVKDSCHIKRAGSKMKKQVLKAIKESENSGNIIRIGDFLYDASSNDVVIRKRVKPKIDLISEPKTNALFTFA